MKRSLCIHGHFYQPPRENPWLEAVEVQDSAYPYHDWNDRITNECYAPNAASRILDSEKRIVAIVNNYSRMSFNIGPTLLTWMLEHDRETYQAILEADRESQARFSGHGSALAQPYNHMVMPLANKRDKHTQILWGIREFEHRFNRAPEGMWLPETAVDLETLDLFAEFGIRFTILAPHQAQRVRPIEKKEWQDVSGGKIDPKMPYLLRLASGRTIALFFYDGPVSRAVAFENLLENGENFAKRLAGTFAKDDQRDQLVHIATDGETYGHHHRHGDMALSYALRFLETKKLARLTNYGEYLEKHPPTHEVEIIENTSWSCAHGVERWRSNCGCHTGGDPSWNQAWRGPLRAALDRLRDELAPRYEDKGRTYLKDPWQGRNEYIRVILDRSPENIAAFLRDHGVRDFDERERTEVLKILELQRHAMLMYTSCGWFFNELSGIETVQVIQYAGRAIQLAGELLGDSLENSFLEWLEQAKSNIPAHKDGRVIYKKFVKSAMVNLSKVGAHYALSSLFEDYEEKSRIYSYSVERKRHEIQESGKAKLAVGRALFTSLISGESATLTYGVLHTGDQNLHGGVSDFGETNHYEEMAKEVTGAFRQGEFSEIILSFDRYFGMSTYSLRSLFRDQQRKISRVILKTMLSHAEAIQSQLYEDHAPLMRFFASVDIPIPKIFYSAAEFVINSSLKWALEEEEPDVDRITSLLEEAKTLDIALDHAGLSYAMRETLEWKMEGLIRKPLEGDMLEKLLKSTALLRILPFEVNLWKVQNRYYEMRHVVYPSFRDKADGGDEGARRWTANFAALGDALKMRIEQ